MKIRHYKLTKGMAHVKKIVAFIVVYDCIVLKSPHSIRRIEVRVGDGQGAVGCYAAKDTWKCLQSELQIVLIRQKVQ
jgi:hypothetical protein